ncbi:hypothetical protein C8J57DRAFT_1230914 [Mycena rebaudengoi]|nr:hypothetical protein C8J57DRAFT_1230914 [Mycena rebaudengoi]
MDERESGEGGERGAEKGASSTHTKSGAWGRAKEHERILVLGAVVAPHPRSVSPSPQRTQAPTVLVTSVVAVGLCAYASALSSFPIACMPPPLALPLPTPTYGSSCLRGGLGGSFWEKRREHGHVKRREEALRLDAEWNGQRGRGRDVRMRRGRREDKAGLGETTKTHSERLPTRRVRCWASSVRPFGSNSNRTELNARFRFGVQDFPELEPEVQFGVQHTKILAEHVRTRSNAEPMPKFVHVWVPNKVKQRVSSALGQL